jgi:hypothetical protein
MSELRATPLRGIAWAILSLVAFGGAFTGAVGVLSLAQRFVDVPHLVDLMLWCVLTGASSLVAVLVLGRLSFGHWLAVGRMAVGLAVLGIGLAVALLLSLWQWGSDRFGVVDWDYLGWTGWLHVFVLALAMAVFGVFVAPRRAVIWPLIATLGGAIVTLAIIATNVPGLRDGIDPESWPLAIWIGVSGVYAIGTALLAIRRPSR